MITLSSTIIIILACVFAVAVITIGYYAHKRTAVGRREYFVAGGTLSPFVIFFTYIASFVSAYGFIGLSAVFYSWGYEWHLFEAIAYPFILIPLTIVIGLRVYKLGKMHNYITNADLIAHRLDLSIPIRAAWAVMVIFPSIFYIGIQLVGMSAVLSGLTGGELPYAFFLYFFSIIMIIYIILGGMRGVAYTDVFQGITIFILICVLVGIVFSHWGGFGELFKAAGTGPRTWVFERTLPVHYFYSALLLSAPVWCGLIPHLWVRYYAAQNIRCVIATGLSVGIGGMLMYAFVPLIMGTAMVAIWPEAPEVAVTEEYVSRMFTEWLGPILTAGLMFGLVAAGKSTADSILLNISSILQVDILEKTLKVKWSERRADLTARVMCIIVLLIALIAAFDPKLPIVRIAITLIWPGFAVIGFPVILMLFWRRINKYGGFGGLVAGFTSLTLFIFVVFPEWPHNPFFLWEGTLPVLIGIAATVIISLLTPPTPKHVIQNFYGEK